MSDKKESILYGSMHDDILEFKSVEDYMNNYVDIIMDSENEDGILRDLCITISAYKLMEVDIPYYSSFVIDKLLEELDLVYSNGQENTIPTQEMKDAAVDFMKTIAAKYKVWMYETIPGTEQTINVLDWVIKNCQDKYKVEMNDDKKAQ